MNDERLQSTLQAWLEARDVRPADVHESVRQVMTRRSGVRQHRRWWPLPPAPTRTSTPTATDTIEYQPSPIPASNGHTPTVIGRTSSMLSPVKAITAGALVFAIGGAFLIAQPFGQQASAPGAEAEAVAPTWVTGTIQAAPNCTSGQTEFDGDVRRSRNVECSPQTWTSSDPRLTGEVVRRWNDDYYRTDEGTINVDVDAAYLRNDDGGWTCSNTSLYRGEGQNAELVGGPAYTYTCTGSGGYAGLSAILVPQMTSGFDEEFVGLIFSGDFPPLPEPPAPE